MTSMQQIDAKSVRFLNACRYYDGTANITEIRKTTGLNRNEANYRFRKLLNMDLIDVTTEPTPGELPNRKVAHLTGKARRELERGLGSATTAGLVISDEPEATEVSRERFREMEQEMQELRESLKSTITDQREVKNLREEVYDLEKYIYDWQESAENYLHALRRAVEVNLNVSLKSYVKTDEDN